LTPRGEETTPTQMGRKKRGRIAKNPSFSSRRERGKGYHKRKVVGEVLLLGGEKSFPVSLLSRGTGGKDETTGGIHPGVGGGRGEEEKKKKHPL